MTWLRRLLAPPDLPWTERRSRLAALPQDRKPRVLYAEPDRKVRPKVRSFAEWRQIYDRKKAS